MKAGGGLALFLAAVGFGGTAGAATPSLVVDVDSGKVLHAERATDPWFPASVTKLMTVYVALEQVRDGRASMSQLLTMSPYAASQPPSKMGFRPGTEVTLENAIKIIMVKSANDVATMIGENLGGGTVDGFAEAMNDAARRLGMRESRWRNPSGLPDEAQHSSARDMAILARALIREFPEQEGLFRIGAIQLGPKIMRNHNGMLGRYAGADGMKTGFICSGGFSIVASATRNGRRLVAVVMGYPSARERDIRAADLFDEGFGSPGWGAQRLETLPPSASLAAPDMRPFICGGQKRQPQEDDESAIVGASAGSNAESGIAALFSSSPFSAAAANAPVLGSRRTLGPRVAFTPIPVWIGATPAEGGAAAAALRLATKPVRTKTVGRAVGLGQLSPKSDAFAAAPTATIMNDPGAVDTLRTTSRPALRPALEANLGARPAAETKPKPGAIRAGTSARARLGAIDGRGRGSLVSSTNPEAVAPASSVRAVAAKPAVGAPRAAYATSKPAPKAAAKPAAKPTVKKPAARAAE